MSAQRFSRDLISNLPDEVLGKILSLLPTKLAASTSVLSKRWRNLLALVDSLDFHDGIGDPGGFSDFVGKTLALITTSSPTLKRFSLNFEFKHDASLVNSWIRTALERGCLELHLENVGWHNIQTEFFTSNTLVKLTVCKGIYPRRRNGIFPALKTLSIVAVSFPDFQMFQYFISGCCPVLEELFLHYSEDLYPPNWSGAVLSPSIKRMTIYHYFPFFREVHDDVLFETPNLVYLDYSSYVADKYEVYLGSLVEARLDLLSWERLNDDYYDRYKIDGDAENDDEIKAWAYRAWGTTEKKRYDNDSGSGEDEDGDHTENDDDNDRAWGTMEKERYDNDSGSGEDEDGDHTENDDDNDRAWGTMEKKRYDNDSGSGEDEDGDHTENDDDNDRAWGTMEKKRYDNDSRSWGTMKKKKDVLGDVTDLVAGISNIKTLHLSPNSLEVFHFCCKSMPVFHNLLTLSFESDKKRGWQVVPLLLTNSPNLKTLVIKGLVHQVTDICGDACPCIPKKKKKKKMEKEVCCLSACQVKVLNISGYGGTCRERKQMRHFLGNLKCLETVKVGVEAMIHRENSNVNNTYQRITNAITELPRASSNCQIHFF